MGNCCSSSSGASPLEYERLPLYNSSSSNTSNSSKSSEDDALLAARFFVRGRDMTVQGQLSEAGRRRGKRLYGVRSGDGAQLLMCSSEVGSACGLQLSSEANRYALQQLLTGLRSHFVYPTLDAAYVPDRNTLITFRRVAPKVTNDLLSLF